MKNIKFSNKKRIFGVILAILALAISPLVLSSVIASLKTAPSITIDTAFYEVNDSNGELMIYITGDTTKISLSDCELSLNISEAFIVAKQKDGSPVLDLLNEGLPTMVERESNKFQLGFRLETYNSTPLPINYTLTIKNKVIQIKETIHPNWNFDPNGGIGAVLSPYITATSADNSDKGETEHVETYIYNPNPYIIQRFIDELAYKISADDYSDWQNQYTPYIGEGVWWHGGETYVVHDWLSPIFTAQSNKKYALNTGTYELESVIAVGSGWFDIYSTPNSFTVAGATGGDPKVIFPLVYYDTEFSGLNWISSVSSYFSDAVSHKMKVNDDGDSTLDTYDDGLEELMNVQYFGSFISGWNPDSDWNKSEMYTDIHEHAGNDIGLSGDWDGNGDDGTRTSYDNHGFDELIALSGTGSENGGAAGANVLVLCAENDPNQKYYELVLVHELSHHFGASHDHIYDCVMQGGELHSLYASGWFVHWLGNILEMVPNFMG